MPVSSLAILAASVFETCGKNELTNQEMYRYINAADRPTFADVRYLARMAPFGECLPLHGKYEW